MVEKKRIDIFDTTLRDGEQSPGNSMTIAEKLRLALQLERMGVDVIEAGFPIASPGDFLAVQEIAKSVTKCQVAGLCRASVADIDRAWQALNPAGDRARIHTFIATSPIHMEKKLKKTPAEVKAQAIMASQCHLLYIQPAQHHS